MNARPVRIFQVVNSPQRRGAEVFAHDLSRALRERGHEVVICYLRPPAAAQVTLSQGPTDQILPRRANSIGLAMELRDAIRSYSPDVVQVNGSSTVKLGSLVAWSEPRREWALIRRVIGDPAAWVRGRARRLFYRHAVMPPVDGVVAVSDAVLDRLRCQGLRTPATVVHRSIDLSLSSSGAPREATRERNGLPPDRWIVAAVGSLSIEKRIDRFLRLVAALPGVLGWIIGEGPERARLELYARELGVSERVRFWGAQGNVTELVRATDLLVLTSDTEGLPGVVLEAGCVGVPAVAARVGGVAECVIHEESGVMLEPNDEHGFVVAVDRLLRDSARRTAMGRAAARLVRERFDLSTAAARFEAFYREVLARRGRTR